MRLYESDKMGGDPEMSEEPEEVTSKAVITGNDQTVPDSPYSGIRRQISEEDLASPAVQRILLGEVDKLQSEVAILKTTEENYHKADKEVAVLTEKLKAMNSQDVMYGMGLSVGSAVIGLSTVIWSTGYGWVSLGIGGLLVSGSVASRIIKWRS